MFVDDYSTNTTENEAERISFVIIPTNMLSSQDITSSVTDDEIIVYYEIMYHRSLQNPTQTNVSVDLLYSRLMWCKSKKNLGKNRIIKALQGLHIKGYLFISNVDIKSIKYTTYLQVKIIPLTDIPNCDSFMQVTESTADSAKLTNKTGQTFKVLVYALWRSRIQYAVTYSEWANLLNLDISNAKRIIKRLKDKKLIRVEKSIDYRGFEANHYYVDGDNYNLIMQSSKHQKVEQLSFENQPDIQIEMVNDEVTSSSFVQIYSEKEEELLDFPIERTDRVDSTPSKPSLSNNDLANQSILQERTKAFDDEWWETLSSYLCKVEEGLCYTSSQLKMLYSINAKYDVMPYSSLLVETIDERLKGGTVEFNFFKYGASIQEKDVIILLNTNCTLALYYGVKRLSLIANSGTLQAKTMVLNWLENAVKHHTAKNSTNKIPFYNWLEEQDVLKDTLTDYIQNPKMKQSKIE
ncbi:hypothetical protein ABC382_00580 [Lysinibacillus sp. 1P01SD]|uniref:hypothetical protein n=1 Tax=Lysinibacillus sp. 1P01SD TaxID=3132285 RepID=UPI0039A3F534